MQIIDCWLQQLKRRVLDLNGVIHTAYMVKEQGKKAQRVYARITSQAKEVTITRLSFLDGQFLKDTKQFRLFVRQKGGEVDVTAQLPQMKKLAADNPFRNGAGQWIFYSSEQEKKWLAEMGFTDF